jgi:hypothetical protein
LARAVDKLINKDYGSLPHGLLLYLIELQQTMQFGLQHPNFSFDYDGKNDNNAANTSQIADSLRNLEPSRELDALDTFANKVINKMS